ncbi:Uncharacterised protein [Mycobacterium tuberculosis]|nr:Uncharacterised protein [Mycobacterium tuberculosis]
MVATEGTTIGPTASITCSAWPSSSVPSTSSWSKALRCGSDCTARTRPRMPDGLTSESSVPCPRLRMKSASRLTTRPMSSTGSKVNRFSACDM